jgi:hypothetical protein
MGSVVYRDRERDYDARTTISSARRDGGGGNYTTRTRYIIKDDSDTRSSHGGRDSRSFVPERAGERVSETRIVRREVDTEEPPRREVRREEPQRYSTEELVIRSNRDDDRRDDRRDPYYDRRPVERSSDQELIIRRTTEEEPRRDDMAMSRFDDRREGYEVISPRRGDFYDRDRDIQRYTRTTDYYSPAPQPQIVVLKQGTFLLTSILASLGVVLLDRGISRKKIPRPTPSRPGHASMMVPCTFDSLQFFHVILT